MKNRIKQSWPIFILIAVLGSSCAPDVTSTAASASNSARSKNEGESTNRKCSLKVNSPAMP